MSSRWVLAMFVAFVCGWEPTAARIVAADEPAGASAAKGGLPANWKQEIDTPDLKGWTGNVLRRGSKLKLWVEDGWLMAALRDATGELEWQIVLAQATDPKPPDVRLDQGPPGFELKYGSYFLRDHEGGLTVLRERKTNQSPRWPAWPIDPDAKRIGHSSINLQAVSLWELGDWKWLGSGLTDNRAEQYRCDIWMRLAHRLHVPPFGRSRSGMQSNGSGIDVYHDDFVIHEEGDLFVGRRSLEPEEQVRTRLASVLNRRPAPELTVKQWLNAPEGMSLVQLKGKAVLLYFWNGAEYDGLAAALQRKYGHRGLVAIGVHPDKDSEKLEALIKERQIEIPIAVASRRLETEQAYTVKIWPTYFLIDGAGRVRQGYLGRPPTDQQLEEFLGL